MRIRSSTVSWAPIWPEQLHGGGDVVEMRDIAHGHRAAGEQCGREDGQRGILRAGDANFARERRAAGDEQFIHVVLIPGGGAAGERTVGKSPSNVAEPRRPRHFAWSE